MKKLIQVIMLLLSWALCILIISITWNTLGTIKIDQFVIGPWVLGISLLNWVGINLILTYFLFAGLPDFVDEPHH